MDLLHGLFFWFCIVSWMPKQKSNVQTTLTLKKVRGVPEVFATSTQHVQNPMGKKKQPMEVHEWLAHVYSATPHGYHPGVQVLLFPTCQVRVVRFYQSCSPPPPPPPPSPPRPPPRSPDPSGHCRTSTSSSRSQWALPDLNRDFQVAVGTAGPQPRLPDRSGHCRTSTASSRSQWALPDLNGQIECQKICQMECQIDCQKICQIECQKICQIECQIECQKICQIECQKICQIECQKICQKICQNICQKICQIECQKICQIECQKICQ